MPIHGVDRWRGSCMGSKIRLEALWKWASLCMLLIVIAARPMNCWTRELLAWCCTLTLTVLLLAQASSSCFAHWIGMITDATVSKCIPSICPNGLIPTSAVLTLLLLAASSTRL